MTVNVRCQHIRLQSSCVRHSPCPALSPSSSPSSSSTPRAWPSPSRPTAFPPPTVPCACDWGWMLRACPPTRSSSPGPACYRRRPRCAPHLGAYGTRAHRVREQSGVEGRVGTPKPSRSPQSPLRLPIFGGAYAHTSPSVHPHERDHLPALQESLHHR